MMLKNFGNTDMGGCCIKGVFVFVLCGVFATAGYDLFNGSPYRSTDEFFISELIEIEGNYLIFEDGHAVNSDNILCDYRYAIEIGATYEVEITPHGHVLTLSETQKNI